MSKSKPQKPKAEAHLSDAPQFAYPVEKGVPIPSQRIAPDQYPLSVMDVGDCFTFPADKFAAVKSAVAAYYKRYGKERKFTTRRALSGIVQGKKVGRVWRIQ